MTLLTYSEYDAENTECCLQLSGRDMQSDVWPFKSWILYWVLYYSARGFISYSCRSCFTQFLFMLLCFNMAWKFMPLFQFMQ